MLAAEVIYSKGALNITLTFSYTGVGAIIIGVTLCCCLTFIVAKSVQSENENRNKEQQTSPKAASFQEEIIHQFQNSNDTKIQRF